nr:MAG TPA: hypothetical protein [Caudoviricetes sp.]
MEAGADSGRSGKAWRCVPVLRHGSEGSCRGAVVYETAPRQ